MQITAVEFDNIKSYRRETIELAPGINAICGLNGSGKTTILEAIGFVLFDYLPYNQQAFLREGERNGSVRVRLQASDGREYEVARKVGASAQYYVIDVESGQKLVDRRPDVLNWVRTNALGIDGGADLEALFKNAVGVPQGLMTSDFLGAARARKAIFDPLLRVEEYVAAWEHLRETISHLQTRSGSVREEMARLEVDVDKIPELESQASDLDRLVAESEQRIRSIGAELAEIGEQKADLDTRKEKIGALRGELQVQGYEVRRQNDFAKSQLTLLEESCEARRIAEMSAEGYRLVEAAERALTDLNVQLRERNRLEQQRTSAWSTAESINHNIERLELDQRQTVRDGEEAVGLASDVARQNALESQLADAVTRVRQGETLDEDLGRVDAEIVELEGDLSSAERQIEEARRAKEDAARIDEVRNRHREILAQVATIESLERQQGDVRVEGERLRKEHDTLRAALDRMTALREMIEAKVKLASNLVALREQERQMRDEQIRIAATIEYQKLARIDLERLRCPLLELQCPVVAVDRENLVLFDTRAGILARREGEVATELEAVAVRLRSASGAAEEIHGLEVELARIENAEGLLAEVTASLERCREEYGALSETITSLKALDKHREILDVEMVTLTNAMTVAAQMPLLLDQLERSQLSLKTRHGDRVRLSAMREAFVAAEAEVTRVRAELDALGDPRSRQHELGVKAARRQQVEEQLTNEQERLQGVMDTWRSVNGVLTQFEGLDARIEEQQRIKDEHRSDHERHIGKREEATQVEVREAALKETREALAAAERAEAETRERLAGAEAAYDSDVHAAIRRRDDELQRELGSATEKRENFESNLTRLNKELSYARQQEAKLRARHGELEGLGRTQAAVKFIRDTIKAAGPAVTETLLSNISQVANDIYAEIMDDYAAELRWDRDYEVLVRRGADDRKFSQLSGGEQMSAALAVRLALLKEMSEVDVAFFDEPTQNMDVDRRTNLAHQIRNVRGFNQLVVISHDDTFEHHTDNLIRLTKHEDESRVDR